MNYRKEREQVRAEIRQVANYFRNDVVDERLIDKAEQRIFTILKHAGFRKVRNIK